MDSGPGEENRPARRGAGFERKKRSPRLEGRGWTGRAPGSRAPEARKEFTPGPAELHAKAPESPGGAQADSDATRFSSSP